MKPNHHPKDEKHDISTTPALAAMPEKSSPRLIDTGMLHYEASISGFNERYSSGKTLHTIHVWWARRPFSAMRALIFASLCKSSSPAMVDLLTQLTFLPEDHASLIRQARNVLWEQYKQPPKVLDMFSGGGTIPFEVMRLGGKAYSVDSNQLAIFNQKSMLYYSQLLELASAEQILRQAGERVLDRLATSTDPLFPLREKKASLHETFDLDNISYKKHNIIGYYWTYVNTCSACGYDYYLLKRPWLSRKNKRYVALTVENKPERQQLHIEHVNADYEYPTVWQDGTSVCPKCGHEEREINVQNCKEEKVALIYTRKQAGKGFTIPQESNYVEQALLDEVEQDVLRFLDSEVPQAEIPQWSGIMNPTLYGIESIADIVNQRQRVTLLLLIKSLYEEYRYLEQHEGKPLANYIIGLLSALIDQLIDWNCRISMWIPQNEQVGRAFCGPGLPMYWEYIEIDPLMNGPANLHSKLKRIVKGARNIKKFPTPPDIRHNHAQNLSFEDSTFDAIVTDPPYYDNIYYSLLADFFYSWKRLLAKKIDPSLFESVKTDYEHELVASTNRDGSAEKTQEKYCQELQKAFHEASRVLKDDGVFSFIYSHSSLNAWLAIIQAFRHSPFLITNVQPLSIERKHRPRAMTSDAVNTCIAFIARKEETPKPHFDQDTLKQQFLAILQHDFTKHLLDSGWPEKDVALAIFAHGVGLLSNINYKTENNDADMLRNFEQMIKTQYSTFRLKKRKPL